MKYKIAIVGSGPAGFFVAQSLQNAQDHNMTFTIDMIERLPTPWGLVRSGVAPDHQKIKSVSRVFDKISKESGIRLFANVELGKDISLRQLREAYDAVVLATGCSIGRKLGIPGEDLSNCISAADFVPWYNSHPDFANVPVDLSSDTAVIIGTGNVALDIARMLAIDPTELDPTDIALHALDVFKSSKIRKVIICGRRGPEHAAFTAPELRDLLKLKNTDVFLNSDQINRASHRVDQIGEVEKDLINNLKIMHQIAILNKKSVERKLEIKFLAAPKEIKGNNKVEEVTFIVNNVKDGSVYASDKTFTIKAGLVVTAIGYDVFDYSEVKIKNGKIANIAGHVERNIFVAGWAKRGPTGVIGTNKSDSADVVKLLINSLKEPKNSTGIDGILKSGHEIIDQLGWEKINASELISGELIGKPRLKIAKWDELLKIGRGKV
jgi:ferredoxin--NADP+ reductase